MNWTHPPLLISAATGLILLVVTLSTGGEAQFLWLLWACWAVLGVMAIRQARALTDEDQTRD